MLKKSIDGAIENPSIFAHLRGWHVMALGDSKPLNLGNQLPRQHPEHMKTRDIKPAISAIALGLIALGVSTASVQAGVTMSTPTLPPTGQLGPHYIVVPASEQPMPPDKEGRPEKSPLGTPSARVLFHVSSSALLSLSG